MRPVRAAAGRLEGPPERDNDPEKKNVPPSRPCSAERGQLVANNEGSTDKETFASAGLARGRCSLRNCTAAPIGPGRCHFTTRPAVMTHAG